MVRCGEELTDPRDDDNVTPLREVARVIRSKNAGPFGLTIDILFEDTAQLDAVAQAGVLSATAVAMLYDVDPATVTVIRHEASKALKIAIVRPTPAGSLNDRDIYGAQQHVPLLDVEIP